MAEGTLVCSLKLNELVLSTWSDGHLATSIIEWAPHYEDETIKPSIGRTFNTLGEARFSVRRGKSDLNKNRELIGKLLHQLL